MFGNKQNIITVEELKTYLYSLEQAKEKEKAQEVNSYTMECDMKQTKVRKREIAKIEKIIDKNYVTRFKVKDEIVDLLEEAKEIPKEIENLKIAEYMLYRVDIKKAEKIVNKVTKKLEKRFDDVKTLIENRIHNFPVYENIEKIDFSELNTVEEKLAKSKEQYKMQYTEEERKQLIKKELDMIEQLKQFNSIPIPHEILKNSDRDIQSKMQKFNNIRQKRIRILETMQNDYEKLLDPREELALIEDAFRFFENVENILTRAEYKTVINILNRRKRKINRSTNDIRSIIETKEKKTGLLNFNIQQSRYVRMENLRNVISEATTLIKENPIEETEEQLEKLRISYQREKQFASVIEKLNEGRGDNNAEVRAYEKQINNLEIKLANSKRIVTEQETRIKEAKKELLVLWKMEINAAVDKKKEGFSLLGTGGERRETRKKSRYKQKSVYKLEKSIKRQTCL